MRILFLVSSMEGGGAERVAALLCNRWVKQGYQVVLMPTFSGRGGCSYPLDPRVDLQFLVDRTQTRLARTQLGRLLALRRAVREIAPDVVLSFLTNVNVAAILAGGGTPVIVSERIYPPMEPTAAVWNGLRRLTYPAAASVVMQTRQGLRWLESTIPSARGAIIPNPIVVPIPEVAPILDPSMFIAPDQKLLLNVARLVPQKNLGLLIDAFAVIAAEEPAWRLVILGEGPERQELEARVAALTMSSHIYLVGQAGNLDSWYQRADAFAFTSRFEGFPNALLEAVAYGVPSLSLDCPTGPAELIEHGVNGLLLPVNSSSSEVASQLRHLLSSHWPQTDAKAARMRETYRIETVANEWVKLFERLLAERQDK